MIFLDANQFLRLLAPPVTAADAQRQEQAGRLFASIAAGEMLATTSEVVLHEVCFVLGSKRHYGMEPEAIVDRVGSLLGLPAFVFPGDDKLVYQRALELWEQHPQIEFSDSVIAARCERGGYELATFDSHFERIPSVTLWRPEPGVPPDPENTTPPD